MSEEEIEITLRWKEKRWRWKIKRKREDKRGWERSKKAMVEREGTEIALRAGNKKCWKVAN